MKYDNLVLTAIDAHKKAIHTLKDKQLPIILDKIRQSALSGNTNIIFCDITENNIKVLKSRGFRIKKNFFSKNSFKISWKY